jgi:hypothetical protein
MEYWNGGIPEYWGKKQKYSQLFFLRSPHPNIPSFHYSNIPKVASFTPCYMPQSKRSSNLEPQLPVVCCLLAFIHSCSEKESAW